LRHLPVAVNKVLELSRNQVWAKRFADKQHALFLGRGRHYPIALEGALKLKEISYIHAEAYPAGELKHGPLALVDAEMPVISVAPNDQLLDKLKSNLKEVQARGGELYVFADADSEIPESEGVHILRLPSTTASCPPSCTSSRCNCCPTMLPWSREPMWTSRATWPNRSRWNKPPTDDSTWPPTRSATSRAATTRCNGCWRSAPSIRHTTACGWSATWSIAARSRWKPCAWSSRSAHRR
jgi:hypothetical protein